MCWYWAILIRLASWNLFSSLQEAWLELRLSQMRLCSLTQIVWWAAKGVFSLVLKSPAKRIKTKCLISQLKCISGHDVPPIKQQSLRAFRLFRPVLKALKAHWRHEVGGVPGGLWDKYKKDVIFIEHIIVNFVNCDTYGDSWGQFGIIPKPWSSWSTKILHLVALFLLRTSK